MALVALVFVTLCISPNVARAARVDVVVDSTEITLADAGGGKQTGKLTLANISDSLVNIQGAIPGDPGCTVVPDPGSIQSAHRTEVTLTLTSCDTEDGADISLTFSPHVTPSSYVIKASAPAAATRAKWYILAWSFLISTILGGVVAAGTMGRARQYNGGVRVDPAPYGPNPPRAPVPTVDKEGRLLAGKYRYAVTFVTDKGESALSSASDEVVVAASHEGAWQLFVNKLRIFGKFGNAAIVLEVPCRKGRQKETTTRRIYRSRNGSEFARVAEIADNTTKTSTDNRRLNRKTVLLGLGTDWDFKDNWVNSVTIGSGVLIALLAASNVLEAILGSKPDEAAIGLLAVTAALSAVFVGISPLIVKLFGEKLSVPTVGGTLLAAWVTLIGAIGQITAVTWQVAELVSGWWVRVGMVVLGAVVAALVLWYAWRALWHFIKTGSEDLPSKRSDALLAADAVAASIKGVASSNRLAANVFRKAITLAMKPDEAQAQQDLQKAEGDAQAEHTQVVAEQSRILKALHARERLPRPERNSLL